MFLVLMQQLLHILRIWDISMITYNAMFCFISICESLKVLIAESGQYSMSIIHEHKPVSMRFKTAE